jgi:hypothetical protein
MWSAQEDEQIVGRIQRRGQVVTPTVYRLVLESTTDVFLHNISFQKGAVLEAFTAPSAVYRSLFDGSSGIQHHHYEQIQPND